MPRIVVAGASLGGLRVAESLRAAGHAGEIVVVGAERHLPYNRPPLSKEALAQGVTHTSVAFRMRKSVADVTWRLGMPVTSASLADREVVLGDGELVPYDGLVAATGLRPRRLAVPGPTAGRLVLRTLEDAAALRARLRPGARLVVVGAGFIGCEVAATATTLGATVTVVAPEHVPMLLPLGEELGRVVQRRHESHGVRFHLGTGVAAYEGADRVTAVRLPDGKALPADVVVEAIGARPNVEWLSGNGLDLSDGVLCDAWMRVEGRREVVAVGDLARFPNTLFDDVPRRVEHWNMPTETAKRAAPALVAGLAGAPLNPAPFAPMPAFWSDQYDLHLQSFGLPGLADQTHVLEGRLGGEVVVGYLRHGRLVGVAGVGSMQALLRYRAQIASGRADAVA